MGPLPGTTLSSTHPTKPPTNIDVVSSTVKTWSSSTEPETNIDATSRRCSIHRTNENMRRILTTSAYSIHYQYVSYVFIYDLLTHCSEQLNG